MAVWLELYGGVGIEVRGEGVDEGALAASLSSLFSRRYLPVRRAVVGGVGGSSVVEWVSGDGFRVLGVSLGGERDYYRIVSGLPEPYRLEQPVFFMLQVAAREYSRHGLVLFTDTVAIPRGDGRAVLVLGYPHGGKSTLAALATIRGYAPYSTENTVVGVDGSGRVRVLGGTRVLVYDPRALARYTSMEMEPDDVTRHGYYILDLDRRWRLTGEAVVDAIYLIHCSLVSTGLSMEKVSGRKALKTLWHFSSALIRGDDYYEPYPLNLATPDIDSKLSELLQRIVERYHDSFYEVFGSHDKVLDAILESHH